MLYAMTIPTYCNGLTALSEQLIKARAWANDTGVAEEDIIAARLAPDMFSLATQVRFSCAQAMQAATRLGAAGAPEFADDASDFSGLEAQLRTTLDWLAALDPTLFDVTEKQRVSFDLPNAMVFDLSAVDYVRDWALPQYYFHLVAAYAVLRHKGVPLGKADFASYMLQHLRPGTMPAAA